MEIVSWCLRYSTRAQWEQLVSSLWYLKSQLRRFEDWKWPDGWRLKSLKYSFIHPSGGCCYWLGPQRGFICGYLPKCLPIISYGFPVSSEHNEWFLRICIPRRIGRSSTTICHLDSGVIRLHCHHSHRSTQTLRRALTPHYMQSTKSGRSYCCGQHGKYNLL